MQLRPIDQPDGPKNELNYYHCIVTGLAFDMPMQQVVDAVTPNPDAEELKALKNVGSTADGADNGTVGYVLVPHQLHVFKEKMPKKFAMVTYFLQPLAAAAAAASSCGTDEDCCALIPVEEDKVSEDVIARRQRAHEHVVKYFTNSHKIGSLKPTEVPLKADGTKMTLEEAGVVDPTIGVSFMFAQPKTQMNAVPFLTAMDDKLEMLKKEECADVKKLRTWMLSKVELDEKATFVADDSASSSNAPTSSSLHIGSADSSTINPAVEWAWLRTQHRKFPPTPTSELITAFFVKGFHPFFTYKDTITVSNELLDVPSPPSV